MRIKLIRQAATPLSSFPVFTVPANTAWKVLYGHSELVTSTGASARLWKISVHDDLGNTMSDTHAGVTQGVSSTRHYSMKQGIIRETGFIGDSTEIPLAPDLILLEGWTITLEDENSVNGDDTMSLHLVLLAGNLSSLLSSI